MKLTAKNIKLFIISSIFFVVALFVYTLAIPSVVDATCWCQNGFADGCQCERTGTSAYPSDFGGVTVYCDSAEEAASFWANRAPVCGSSHEVVPYCAPATGNSGLYFCWGYDYVSNNGSVPGIGTYQLPGGFTYNGGSFGSSGENYEVYVCGSNVSCCANEAGCDLSGAPGAPAACERQALEVFGYMLPMNPACDGGAIAPPTTSGVGESRLWFSQARLVSALSAMAQAMFNPFRHTPVYDDGAFSKNAPPSDTSGGYDNLGALTSRVELHQGADDSIPVVNTDTNNSSVIVGAQVPAPLDPYYELYQDRACYIDDAHQQPGDDLIGAKIRAEQRMTVQFDLNIKGQPSGCQDDGSTYVCQGTPEECTEQSICEVECCSAICQANEIRDCVPPEDDGGIGSCPPTNFEAYTYSCPSILDVAECCSHPCLGQTNRAEVTCGTLTDLEIPVGGQASVHDKSPLIENIYQIVLADEDSLFRRFMSVAIPNIFNFEETPTKTGFGFNASVQNFGSTRPGSFNQTYANGLASSPELYVPHLGTLYESWLQDFQKALQPEGGLLATGDIGTIPPGVTPPVSSGLCTDAPAPYSGELAGVISAARAMGGAASLVPTGVLETIYFIESFGQWNNPSYTCSYNAWGALGLMQITDAAYNYVVPPSQRLIPDEHVCSQTPGYFSRCNPIDAIELAARVLLYKVDLWNFNDFVPRGGSIDTLEEVYCSSAGYYGSTNPDQATNDRGENLNVPSHPISGGTNYSEVVCYDSGFCIASTYPYPRPPAGACMSSL